MKYYLASNYKRYNNGGWTAEKQSNMEAGMGLATTAVGMIDALAGTNQYGRKPLGVSIASGAVNGAAMGAKLGPLGAVAGGVIGGGLSLITGLKEKKAENRLKLQESMNYDSMQRARSAAILAANPQMVYGDPNATYFAKGGQLPLSSAYMNPVGGEFAPMSSDAVEVQGNSHEQGGVKLPAMGAELEGGETVQGDFVFSKELGFADEHKKIAKAIGKIESKGVMSPERVNAITRLKEREESLKLSQEYFKEMFL